MKLKLPLVLLPLVCLTAAVAAPARPARMQAPEVRSQGYRFVVEQVQAQQYEQIEFPPGAPENPEKAEGKSTGRQHLFVRLAVHPPQPGLLPHIEGLDPKVLATAAGKPLTLRGYPVEDSGPLLGGIWRHQLSAQEVDLSATHLSRLQGELIVYPRARVVALDLPLAAKLPAARQIDGFQATLRSARTRAQTLTVAVEIEWPASLSVTRPNPDSPTGVVAVTNAGSSIMPSGSSSSNNSKTGWVSRTHTLTFVDVKELPEKIRVEALVRSGAAQRIRFTLPDIALPQTFAPEADPSDAPDGGPLDPGDPLYSKNGGTVAAPVRSKVPGELVLGLARLADGTGGTSGPWRWLQARMEPGRAVLTHVRPGRYRVARAWAPPPGLLEPAAAPIRIGEILEVEVAAGQTVTLAPVEVRETP